MSVPVELEKLKESVDRFGALPYLLTTAGDGRPHAVSVHVSWDGPELAVRAGRSTVANATARPLVSLLWAPVDEDGFSLIVDGTAVVDRDRVSVRPLKAVLHRQASPPGEASVSDCVGVLDHVVKH